MMCATCKHMNLITFDEWGGTRAKCMITKTRQKIITWALSIPEWHHMDPKSKRPRHHSGRDCVVAEMNKDRLAPYWCPVRKGLVQA